MPNCTNCGTEMQPTDKFCRECGKSSVPAPSTIEPKSSEIKLTPAEMVEFQKWQKMVKGTSQPQASQKPTAANQAEDFAKITGDFFRSFREITDGVKKDINGTLDAANKTPTSAPRGPASVPVTKEPVKPQLSPEETIEFNKWRQMVKEKNEQDNS
jgi:hypothetical protein